MNTDTLQHSKEAIRELIEFADGQGFDRRELYEHIFEYEEYDFEIGNYRFIKDSEIDEIQIEELESDPYLLGCFNSSCIASNTNLNIDIVEALQEAEKFETLGKYIIQTNKTGNIQDDYKTFDGYGHHFAYYDHNDCEFSIGNDYWHLFRTN